MFYLLPEEPGGALGRGEGAGETSAISGGDGRGGVAVGDPDKTIKDNVLWYRY